MAQSDVEAGTAAFLPWRTLKGYLQSFQGEDLPPQIDSSMFRKKSGSDAQGLRTAFRFFDLTEGEAGTVTDRFKVLVDAVGTTDWPTAVSSVILSKYDEVLAGVDVRRGTQKQLDDAFRERAKVSGTTLKKAVRFYLSAAKEAGVKVSPYFVAVRGVGSSNTDGSDGGDQGTETIRQPKVRRAKGKGKRNNGGGGGAGETFPPSNVQVLQPLPGRAFKVWIPDEMEVKELAFAFKYVRDYLSLHGRDFDLA